MFWYLPRFFVLGEGGQRGLQLIVSGPDQDVVVETAAKLQREMASIPTVENPMSTAPLNRPEIRISPKPDLAVELGVSTDVLSETVRVATIGDVGANLAKFNAGDRQIPIRVQLPEAVRGDHALIDILKVPAKGGAAVPLSPSPTSRSGRDRPLSTATTASCAWGSRLTCGARMRSARCWRLSTTCRRQKISRRA